MTHNKTLTNSLVILFLLAAVPLVTAQEPSDDSTPAENNIVCFAAKKQWVCAPADEQEKAQEKAMKLALEPDKPDLIDDSVEIQTLQPVNIGEQAQEMNPDAAIQFAIKDFTPREDAIENDATEETEEKTVQNQVAVNQPTIVVAAAPKQQAATEPSNEPPNPLQESREFASAPSRFGYWQENFAEQWTFQVVGTSNRHHLNDFIAQHGLQQQSHAIVRTQRDGADWWIVLTGLYASKEQAKSQQQYLPAALAHGAWVRQIKTIEGQAD